MITKVFVENDNQCRVTFLVPPDIRARTANLCGDFNGWSTRSHPMDRHPDGSFSLTVELESGKDYCFRYFVDGYCWFNDEAADGYIYNQSDNLESVICLKHSQTIPSRNSVISETCVLAGQRVPSRQILLKI